MHYCVGCQIVFILMLCMYLFHKNGRCLMVCIVYRIAISRWECSWLRGMVWVVYVRSAYKMAAASVSLTLSSLPPTAYSHTSNINGEILSLPLIFIHFISLRIFADILDFLVHHFSIFTWIWKESAMGGNWIHEWYFVLYLNQSNWNRAIYFNILTKYQALIK